MLVDPGLTATGSRVVREGVVRRVSDPCPVLVEFVLGEGRRGLVRVVLRASGLQWRTGQDSNL